MYSSTTSIAVGFTIIVNSYREKLGPVVDEFSNMVGREDVALEWSEHVSQLEK